VNGEPKTTFCSWSGLMRLTKAWWIVLVLSATVALAQGRCCVVATNKENATVAVAWTAEERSIAFVVTLHLAGGPPTPVSGYVGVGIVRVDGAADRVEPGDPSGAFADFWLGLPGSGSVDDYSFVPMRLRRDERCDLTDASTSTTEDGRTIVVRFSRLLKTADGSGDLDIVSGAYRLLYAYRHAPVDAGRGGRMPSQMGAVAASVDFFACVDACSRRAWGDG
jgi:hypothetical protein